MYKIPILLGAGSLLLAAISIILLVKSTQTSDPIEFSATASSAAVLGVTIDVSGAVVRPGVYTLEAGARVEDAIGAAGGFSKDADLVWIEKHMNRAMKINDGVKIYVPKEGEIETSHKKDCTTSTSDVAQSCIGLSGQSQNAVGVSINNATQSELESLSGIGPATALKIITGRPYTSLDELVMKKVMSQSLFSKLKSQLAL